MSTRGPEAERLRLEVARGICDRPTQLYPEGRPGRFDRLADNSPLGAQCLAEADAAIRAYDRFLWEQRGYM